MASDNPTCLARVPRKDQLGWPVSGDQSCDGSPARKEHCIFICRNERVARWRIPDCGANVLSEMACCDSAKSKVLRRLYHGRYPETSSHQNHAAIGVRTCP